VGTTTYYYLVNHTAAVIDQFLPFNNTGKAVLFDPQTSVIGAAMVKDAKVRIQLKAGQTLFLAFANQSGLANQPWVYLDKPGKAEQLNRPWSLQFTAGGPALPSAQKLEKLVSWTELNDDKLKAFSGTGVYTSTFNLSTKNAKEYVLNLNQVDESAKVWINGKEVGILWSIPFEARIGKYLKVGENTIKIEVVNLMANRIRDMDIQKIQWRNYHEINFVNIDYKEFDASKWNVMPSGLIGPVTITPYLR
jgi:hypothetical protein